MFDYLRIRAAEVTSRVIKVTASLLNWKYLTLILISLSIIQSAVFAYIINDGKTVWIPQEDKLYRSTSVLPDEARHFNNIKYYAHKPVTDGPFFEKIEDYLLFIGPAERFPSYLYYYTMSFPLRVGYDLGFKDQQMYLMLRYLTVVMSLGVLLLVVRLMKLLDMSRSKINVVLAMLISTSAFAWISSAINYDIPALFLMLALTINCIQYLKKYQPVYLILALILFLLLSITKYTYIPAAGALGLLTVFVAWRQSGAGLRLFVQQQSSELFAVSRKRPIFITIIAVILAGSLFLFTERIGQNVVRYGSVAPVCSLTHSEWACGRYDIYKRNTDRKDLIDMRPEEDKPVVVPSMYAGQWLTAYTSSTFKFYGHMATKNPTVVQSVIQLLVFLVTLCGMYYFSRYVKLPKNMGVIVATAVLYTILLIGFNIKTYLTYDAAYGYQGRYLLYPLIIFYMYLSLVIFAIYQKYKERKSFLEVALLPVFLVIFASSVVVFNPLYTYISEADSAKWFQTDSWSTDKINHH